MAYSFQTFVFNEIFTATAANQMESNARDHRHGRDDVVPSGLNFSQTNKTASYSLDSSTDNGELFRAGAGSSDMDLDLPDASTAGDTYAAHGLNDNDLQGSVETGVVNFDPAGSDTIGDVLTNWPIAPGEMGSMISSNGSWYPFGFSGMHPIGIVSIASESTVFIIPKGWAIMVAFFEEISGLGTTEAIRMETRISGGSFDTTDTLDLGTAPNGSGYKAVVALFNFDKPDGAQKPLATLLGGFDNGGALSAATEECGANSATEVDALRVQAPGGGLAVQGRIALFGLARRVSI